METKQPLQGSEKQVQWANKVRNKQMAELERRVKVWEGNDSELARLAALRGRLENITSAGQWIALRDVDLVFAEQVDQHLRGIR